jgi:hypothetical protein
MGFLQLQGIEHRHFPTGNLCLLSEYGATSNVKPESATRIPWQS